MTTVAVIGAGPAGLAAVHGAVAHGADVVLIDEGQAFGGQFWRHHHALTDLGLEHEWSAFTRLHRQIQDAEAAGRVRVLLSTSVWHIETTPRLRMHALTGPVDGADRAGHTVDADALVIATGAHDRALPIPGWTLPGVTTAGAAQALAKRDGVTLGRRTVVAGAGPFLLPVAASILHLGAGVAEVVEATGVPAMLRGWGVKPWQLLGATGKVAELVEYVRALAAHRVPYRTASAVTRIHGTDRVEAVTVQRVDARWTPIPGTERTVDCDAVALGHGFTPRLEAAIQAGCDITPDRFVTVDDRQATTAAGVYAAGEVTGIAGADAALAEGVIAGFAAAGGGVHDPRIRGAVHRRHVMAAFARRLATHDIQPGWTAWVDADTIVCRCESVTRGTLDTYRDAPSRAFRLATRAGLGACQGRTCGRSVEDLTGRRLDYDRRPVLSSVRVGELARAGTAADGPDIPAHPRQEKKEK